MEPEQGLERGMDTGSTADRISTLLCTACSSGIALKQLPPGNDRFPASNPARCALLVRFPAAEGGEVSAVFLRVVHLSGKRGPSRPSAAPLLASSPRRASALRFPQEAEGVSATAILDGESGPCFRILGRPWDRACPGTGARAAFRDDAKAGTRVGAHVPNRQRRRKVTPGGVAHVVHF